MGVKFLLPTLLLRKCGSIPNFLVGLFNSIFLFKGCKTTLPVVSDLILNDEEVVWFAGSNLLNCAKLNYLTVWENGKPVLPKLDTSWLKSKWAFGSKFCKGLGLLAALYLNGANYCCFIKIYWTVWIKPLNFMSSSKHSLILDITSTTSSF